MMKEIVGKMGNYNWDENNIVINLPWISHRCDSQNNLLQGANCVFVIHTDGQIQGKRKEIQRLGYFNQKMAGQKGNQKQENELEWN